MPSISPYQTKLHSVNVRPFEVNLALENEVFAYKQGKYDKAYDAIQNLKKTALSINFLNQKEQSKIDSFNNQVSQYFNQLNGNLGDLSNNNIANSYTSLFNQIGQDVDLLSRYKKDSSIQSELRSAFNRSKAKKPSEAGWSVKNFQNYQRRVSEYASADLDVSPEAVSFKGYTPYENHDKTLMDRIDAIETRTIKGYKVGTNGVIQKFEFEQKDPDAIRQITSDHYNSIGAVQLAEDLEYDYYNGASNFSETSFNAYQSNLKNTIGQLDSQISKISSALETETNPQQVGTYEQSLDELRKYKSNLVQSKNQIGNYSDLTDAQKLLMLKGDYVNRKADLMASTYGKGTVSREIDTSLYRYNKTMQFNMMKFQAGRADKFADRQLKVRTESDFTMDLAPDGSLIPFAGAAGAYEMSGGAVGLQPQYQSDVLMDRNENPEKEKSELVANRFMEQNEKIFYRDINPLEVGVQGGTRVALNERREQARLEEEIRKIESGEGLSKWFPAFHSLTREAKLKKLYEKLGEVSPNESFTSRQISKINDTFRGMKEGQIGPRKEGWLKSVMSTVGEIGESVLTSEQQYNKIPYLSADDIIPYIKKHGSAAFKGDKNWEGNVYVKAIYRAKDHFPNEEDFNKENVQALINQWVKDPNSKLSKDLSYATKDKATSKNILATISNGLDDIEGIFGKDDRAVIDELANSDAFQLLEISKIGFTNLDVDSTSDKAEKVKIQAKGNFLRNHLMSKSYNRAVDENVLANLGVNPDSHLHKSLSSLTNKDFSHKEQTQDGLVRVYLNDSAVKRLVGVAESEDKEGIAFLTLGNASNKDAARANIIDNQNNVIEFYHPGYDIADDNYFVKTNMMINAEDWVPVKTRTGEVVSYKKNYEGEYMFKVDDFDITDIINNKRGGEPIYRKRDAVNTFESVIDNSNALKQEILKQVSEIRQSLQQN